MKKILAILICMILVSTVSLPVIGKMNINGNNDRENIDNNYDNSSCLLARPINLNNLNTPKSVKGEKIPIKSSNIKKSLNIPIANSDKDELHPTLAMDRTGLLFGAYALKRSIIESNIFYTYSKDGGESWEVSSFELYGFLDYPSVDYWGSGSTFVATFLADPTEANGAAQYRLIVENPFDLETWELIMWEWSISYNQRDRESPDIAGYNNNGEAPRWYYGVIADTQSSDHPDYPGEHNPVLNWANYDDENYGWFWIFTFNNSANACVDIDTSNGMLYAAWDYPNEDKPENGRDILYAVADTHDWMEEIWVIKFYTLGQEEKNTFPDVATDKGHIYIVSQSDEGGTEDIVCYHSADNGDTWNKNIVSNDVTNDELYPSIEANEEVAKCIFTMNGDLYISSTYDGGNTWSIPEKINDEPGSVSTEYRNEKIALSGHTFWTDIRKGNKDIYYKSGEATALLNIRDVSGGLGISVEIENIGSAPATNIQWSIDIDGLILLGIHSEGSISKLDVGSSTTIRVPFVLGFGSVTITIIVEDISVKVGAFLFGPFLIGVGVIA